MNTKVNIVSIENVRESRPVGSGILPFMLRDNGHGMQDILFIMAQEDFSYRWNQSGCWSGFEGGSIYEEDDAETAAREFVEESLYSIPLFGSVDPVHIAERLRAGQHCMKVYVRSENQRNIHTTYVVETPWNENIIAEFYTIRKCLERINNMIYRGCVGKTGSYEAPCVSKTNAAPISCVPTHLREHPAVVAIGGTGAFDCDKFAAMMEKRRIRLCTYNDLHYHTHRNERKTSAKFRLRYRFVPLVKTVLEHMPKCFPSVVFIVHRGLAHTNLTEKVLECDHQAPSSTDTVWQHHQARESGVECDDALDATGDGAAGKHTSDGEQRTQPTAKDDDYIQ